MPSFTGIVMNDNMNFSVTNGSVRMLIDLFSIEILFYRTKFWLEVLILELFDFDLTFRANLFMENFSFVQFNVINIYKSNRCLECY
jgi:hypothetical protein